MFCIVSLEVLFILYAIALLKRENTASRLQVLSPLSEKQKSPPFSNMNTNKYNL